MRTHSSIWDLCFKHPGSMRTEPRTSLDERGMPTRPRARCGERELCLARGVRGFASAHSNPASYARLAAFPACAAMFACAGSLSVTFVALRHTGVSGGWIRVAHCVCQACRPRRHRDVVLDEMICELGLNVSVAGEMKTLFALSEI